MTTAWMLTSCTRRSWGTGRRILIEQRNGFKRAPKKPESGQNELRNSPETTSRSTLTPFVAEPVYTPRSHILKKLHKPFLFTVGFSGCSFGIAAIWEYESLKNKMRYYVEEIPADWLDKLRPPKHGTVRKKVNEWWNSLSDGQKTVSGIIAANCLVFFLWKIPSMQRIMIRYFTSNPASKSLCLPMTLSTFSHYFPMHLALNMYVLWSFSSIIVSILGQEQFLALYMSAGVISSFASCVYKVATGRIGPSLGASGAIMTILAVVCMKMPESKLAFVFLPMFPFTAGNALLTLLAVDSVGVILGWKVFDHAAHLGGALFGIWYALYGQELIWKNREPLIKMWRDFRNSPPRSGGS